MVNTKTAVVILIIAFLFVASIAGTIIYYNNKIADLNTKIQSLQTQVSNLKMAKIPTGNLLTYVGVAEIPSNSSHNYPSPMKYNHLYIEGTVNNTGKGTALNAGLRIVAYDSLGMLEVNMTVPLNGELEVYGTDSTIASYVSSIYGEMPIQLGNLYSEQSVTVDIGIFHKGTVTNWTVTPVWTNKP